MLKTCISRYLYTRQCVHFNSLFSFRTFANVRQCVHFNSLFSFRTFANVVSKLGVNTQLSGQKVAIIVKVYNIFRRHFEIQVQVGKDQEKAQSEKDSHSKNRGGKKKQTNNQALIP